MPVRKLRAAVTAILLSTAASCGAALVLAAPAQAATVSAKVGPLLKEAQAMIAAKNYAGAKAKLNEADALKSTPDDAAIINQFRSAISISSADPNTPGGAKAKFAQDYNAGKFKDVIADAEYLKKNNVFDAQSQLIVGQAYYKAADYAGCVKYTKSLGSGETALALQARCAYEVGDDVSQRAALEQLVARTGKSEYWVGLLKLGERARGLSDHNTLDLNRLRLLTGAASTKDDYISLAQFALQFGFAAEALSVMDKGAKLLSDDRSQRLMTRAKADAAARRPAKPRIWPPPGPQPRATTWSSSASGWSAPVRPRMPSAWSRKASRSRSRTPTTARFVWVRPISPPARRRTPRRPSRRSRRRKRTPWWPISGSWLPATKRLSRIAKGAERRFCAFFYGRAGSPTLRCHSPKLAAFAPFAGPLDPLTRCARRRSWFPVASQT